MKDHRRVEFPVAEHHWNPPLKDVIEELQALDKQLKNARLIEKWGKWHVEGWIPFTAEEKAAAEKRREASRKGAAKRKKNAEAKRRARMEELAKEFGMKIVPEQEGKA